MAGFEYKVVPAPTKGQKAKGIRSSEDRFAHAVELLINKMALDGWEFQRSETLPSTERSGLTSTTTSWNNILVFRRRRPEEVPQEEPKQLAAPTPDTNDATTAPVVVLDAPQFESSAEDLKEFDSLGRLLQRRAALRDEVPEAEIAPEIPSDANDAEDPKTPNGAA